MTCTLRAGTRRSSTTTGGLSWRRGRWPHPAAVDLAGPVAGLPRRPVRVFECRDTALGVLERALAARGGAVVTQAVYRLGGVGKSELALALQYAIALTTAWCGGLPRPMP